MRWYESPPGGPTVSLLALLYLTVSNPDLLTRLKTLQFAGEMQQALVPTSSTRVRKLVVRAALAIVVFLVTVVLLALCWPLSREAVLKELEDESRSRVNIGRFMAHTSRGRAVCSNTSLSSTTRKLGRHRSVP